MKIVWLMANMTAFGTPTRSESEGFRVIFYVLLSTSGLFYGWGVTLWSRNHILDPKSLTWDPLIYIIKGVWAGRSVVGSVVDDVVVRGQASKHLSSRVCEVPMHCCSPVSDCKFWMKTVNLPCLRVTHENKDGEIQDMKYCTTVHPLLTLNRFR